MSLGRRILLKAWRAGLPILAAASGAGVWAQYPGQVQKDAKQAPELRAVAVLEWTGELGKPKACRIIPVSVLAEGQLQDGGIYLARPQPMALDGETEYELKENGKTIGLFDIENAGQELGSWVGFGKWRALPAPPKPKMAAPVDVDDEDDDKPVLHRKKHPGDTGGSKTSSGSGSGSSTTAANEPAPDPDRPVLHKKDESASSPAPATGSPAGGTSGQGAAQEDADRPKLTKKQEKNPAEDIGHVDSLPDISDPDRPRLKRGKSTSSGPAIAPSLMGLPPDMQQAVAVSDARNTPDHPWSYSWANPADEAKMKASMEGMAREALGLTPPAPAPKKSAARPATKTPSGKVSLKALDKPNQDNPNTALLPDEQFRVFELAYGSGATMVLTAHTDAPGKDRKYVTLIAQPDLYGDLRLLMKSVTDGAHLDETPRMRLIDAVDAMADNRGELLFELRSDSQRQFALYRVYRGQAEELFVTGGGEWGTASN